MPKKTTFFIFITIVFLLTIGGYFYLSHQGYKVNFSIVKREYKQYQNDSPKFSFSYPFDRFEIDSDEEGHFGESYLVGIKLPSDHQVGCDVRAVGGSLNLDGNLNEIAAKLAQQVSQGADFFHSTGGEFTQIGGEKAVKLKITFSGPLGGLMRTDQIFTSHNGLVYTFICGSTKGTFEFFAEDFEYFFKSFSFK